MRASAILLALLPAASVAQTSYPFPGGPIPDPNPPGTCATSSYVQPVAGPAPGVTITKVTLTVDLQMFFAGDLRLRLAHGPANLTLVTPNVTPTGQACLDGVYTLDDAAPLTLSSVIAATPPGQIVPSGVYRADSLLSAFNGTNASTLWTVTVTNCGYSTFGQVRASNHLTITTGNPVPVLTLINPSNKAAGQPAFTLTASGSGFVNGIPGITGSVVRWNGQNLATVFGSVNTLAATVEASRIATPGTASVTVFTPAPGGGTSNPPLTFTITVPVAAITATSPAAVPEGAYGFTMVVNGSDFLPGCTAQVNGQTITGAARIDATTMHVPVPQSAIAATGPSSFTVGITNPGAVSSPPRTVPVTVVTPHTHELASVNDLGVPADADCRAPSASRFPRFVAFHSAASNLDGAGPPGVRQVYVRDLLRKTTRRVSNQANGAAGTADSYNPSTSGSGRYVLFTSAAAGLVAGLSPAFPQVYRHDRDTDNDGVFDEPGATATILASVDPANPGAPANAACTSFKQGLSESGSRAVFQSAATNLGAAALGHAQCWLRNFTSGTTSLASATPSGTAGNGPSQFPSVSGDGGYVVFHSDATDLAAADANGVTDVFRKTVSSGNVGHASRPTGNGPPVADGPSLFPVVSYDGRWVSFESDATNLVGGDGNAERDVFRRDFTTMATALVSTRFDALGNSIGPGNFASFGATISPTGCTGFATLATDLSPLVDDTNQVPDMSMWNPPTQVPTSVYAYPGGPVGDGASGTGGTTMSEFSDVVAYTTFSRNLTMNSVSQLPGLEAIVVTYEPLDSATAPVVDPDANPVTFSVNGPVDLHTEGITGTRGVAAPTPPLTRLPAVPKAAGIASGRPGDVNDHFVLPPFVPSEAELFQSEPDEPVAAPPSGTNNQILVAAENGLASGLPAAAARDNIDGVSFGEDYFGVRGVSTAPSPALTTWSSRTGSFAEPLVTSDIGTSFRFSVDPWATGLVATGVADESGGSDTLLGTGAWSSPGEAAGDVFATPVLTIPGPPLAGINTKVHDEYEIDPVSGLPEGLGLLPGAAAASGIEDDLDALECVGTNDWGGVVRQPGNLHARVSPAPGAHPPDLAPPGVANHVITPAGPPVFITVSRNSTGEPGSAVRSQFTATPPEAAADVFMELGGTNYLLIDEEEAGLWPGLAVAGGGQTDDMDALMLQVHAGDQPRLPVLAALAFAQTSIQNAGQPNERRVGPGFTESLIRWVVRTSPDGLPPLRIRLAFSVTTDSIGLAGTAVDFEAGGLPGLAAAAGPMTQAGDIYYTEFGSWTAGVPGPNPAPGTPAAPVPGMNWLWYDETAIGLDAGAWFSGSTTGLGSLPDELNGLDAICAAPIGTGSIITYGDGTAGSGAIVPRLGASGWTQPGRPIAFWVDRGLGGAQALVLAGTTFGWHVISTSPPCILYLDNIFPHLLDPQTWLMVPLQGAGSGGGFLRLPGMIPPGVAATLHLQVFIADPGGCGAFGFSATNALRIDIQ